MQIQVNTDNHISGSQKHNDKIIEELNEAFQRFSDWLTRVEVHVTDESGSSKSGNVFRCLIEARPAGRQPVSVSHTEDAIDHAVSGAASKMVHQLDTISGKLRDADRRLPVDDIKEDEPDVDNYEVL